MRVILSTVAILLGVLFLAENMEAGPIVDGNNLLIKEVIPEIKLLFQDTTTLQKGLVRLQSEPTNQVLLEELVRVLDEFREKLVRLSGKISKLIEMGTIAGSYVVFIEIKLHTCTVVADLLIDDLAQTPPNFDHSTKMRTCRTALKSVMRPRCFRKCQRTLTLPILNEPTTLSTTGADVLIQALSQYRSLLQLLKQIQKPKSLSSLISNLHAFLAGIDNLGKIILQLRDAGKLKLRDTERIFFRSGNCRAQLEVVIGNLNKQSVFSKQTEQEVRRFSTVCQRAMKEIKKSIGISPGCKATLTPLSRLIESRAAICIRASSELPRQVHLLSIGKQTAPSANGVYLIKTEKGIQKTVLVK